MGDEILLTKEGYAKLKAEYEELVSVTRKEVAERLKEARAFGDLSENAEYDAALDEQAETEERIQKLEETEGKFDIIFCGLGASESDPFKGIISNVSPIGKGLLKHKVGDVVEIETPGGKVTLEIRAIQMYSAGKDE